MENKQDKEFKKELKIFESRLEDVKDAIMLGFLLKQSNGQVTVGNLRISWKFKRSKKKKNGG